MLRDPTRGGVAATLNEICRIHISIMLNEKKLPVLKELAADVKY
ncbi:MAG: hypothetical protein R2771_05175 [Saprospiraceae bacterium]